MGDAAGCEVGAKDMERAALAGADFDMDVVKKRLGDVLTGVFEDAGAGESVDRLRDEVISWCKRQCASLTKILNTAPLSILSSPSSANYHMWHPPSPEPHQSPHNPQRALADLEILLECCAFGTSLNPLLGTLEVFHLASLDSS